MSGQDPITSSPQTPAQMALWIGDQLGEDVETWESRSSDTWRGVIRMRRNGRDFVIVVTPSAPPPPEPDQVPPSERGT